MTELLRSARLGAASGLRSMAAPSQLSRHLAGTTPNAAPGAVGEFLARGPAPSLLQIAALGEMVADKLPGIPDRIEHGPLAGRAFFGSTAGGLCARIHGESMWRGAIVGGIAAVMGAFAGYYVRRALVHGVGLPDLPVALCEDVLALVLARGALRD